jgi:hypothetical protein
MAKQTRTQRKVKSKHRARKPRPVRPLDVAKADNHEARHEARKMKRAAHEALMAKQAAEKAARCAATALVAVADFGPTEARLVDDVTSESHPVRCLAILPGGAGDGAR